MSEPKKRWPTVEYLQKKLTALGIAFDGDDEDLLKSCCKKAAARIKTACNVKAVPDGMMYAATDMACGEFLSAKKIAGGLTAAEANAVVRHIQEGDASVTYAVEDSDSPSAYVNALIGRLLGAGERVMAHYRKMGW